MSIGCPAKPNIMVGTVNADCIQIIWNSVNNLACGSVTYHVELRVRADDRLIKQDTTMDQAYKFNSLSPNTYYTAFVYGSNRAGDGTVAMIPVTTASANNGKVFLVFCIIRSKLN